MTKPTGAGSGKGKDKDRGKKAGAGEGAGVGAEKDAGAGKSAGKSAGDRSATDAGKRTGKSGGQRAGTATPGAKGRAATKTGVTSTGQAGVTSGAKSRAKSGAKARAKSGAPSSARQKLQHKFLYDKLKQLEWDLHQKVAREEAIPDDWHVIAGRPHGTKKVRISMWVEEDVVRFFKSLGHPYQPRMNDVLKAFMHAKLAGVIREAEMVELYFHRADVEERPQLGAAEWWEE